MDLVKHILCPSCHTPLQSARGIRVGKKVTCPHCGIGFTVRPEDAEQAELSAGVNPSRLGVVLGCVVLFFISGLGLAIFCVAENRPAEEEQRPGAVTTTQSAQQTDVPPGPAPSLKLQPASLGAADQLEVDRAIARGVWYLRDTARPGGGWGDRLPENNDSVAVGFACLPALALLECGVPPSDPVIQAAAQLVREQIDHLRPPYVNYQRSLAILFLDRLDDKRDVELIQHLAVTLILGQHPTDGAWTYRSPAPDRKIVPRLMRLLKDPRDVYTADVPKNEDAALHKQLLDEKQFMSAWRTIALGGGAWVPTTWDNSNTQFALLALWVAQRHGVAIDRSIALAEQHFRSTQLLKDEGPRGDNLSLEGSWYYDLGGRPFRNSSRWPTMTCAGLLGLAEAHGITTDPKEKKQRPLEDPAIKKGLEMLAREIDRPNDPRRDMPDYYFLWSLERVGVLFNLREIEGKDWYAWGCKVLLPRQLKENGSWTLGGYYGSANNPALDTAFVLLFLKQANLVQSLTDKLEMLAQLVAPNPSVQPPAKQD